MGALLKSFLLIAALIALIVGGVFILLNLRGDAPYVPGPAVPGPTVNSPAADGGFSADQLRGTWREIGDEDAVLRITAAEVTYQNIFGQSGKARYRLERGLGGGGERNLEFPDYDGPFEYIIWHEEEIGGRTVGVLSGVIMEYDGRGPVTFDEFLRDDCGVEVPDGWRSEVSHRLNDREAAPTWIDPDGEAE